ncbi:MULTISPECIES: 50S ribosomal protein L35 [Geomicrobium]|uniref:Large ribosomal subunit protein bL35 n=1 Tax=Geomicrobium sediminis TaxID=1347788 RepID=A0ABS2P8Z7_9BACL|nr:MULTISPECIES: 50S ribosomal protein L35 [Geomicrobium]EZH66767.1 50S ribosomal protein L35 [Bacillaceae bacterium JMAK1]MBM7631787.1 large subunit ribosomal protein L35 [Geomicrobium sediminis]GAJ99346.1 LSU ribosomal protein L35p [Geomicrobium sp. JCM 19055]GAK09718.1 LSU ribosomal protein L35p [Geomicrobium sp. JCM 19038]
MPKMKTHRGAAKRFKRTGTGKLKRGHANTSHLAAAKSEKQKRHLSKQAVMDKSDQSRIEQLLPYKK